MAWRIVKQPDGLYARFSEVVNHFTHSDMTRDEALLVCVEYGLRYSESQSKVQRADDEPNRYNEAVQIIKDIHNEPWPPSAD